MTHLYINQSVLESGVWSKPYCIVKKKKKERERMCVRGIIGQTEGEVPCDRLGKSNKFVAADVALARIVFNCGALR